MASGIRRQIPNAITVSRLVMACGLFVLLGLAGAREGAVPTVWLDAALGLFVLASLSDALDGYLARKWGVVSRFGRIVDPFADKILVLGAAVYLAGPALSEASRFSPSIVVILLARELLVTALRSEAEGSGRDFSAKWAGKMKMILQSVAIACGFLHAAHATSLPEDWQGPMRMGMSVLVWSMAAVTVWSGWPYLQAMMKRSSMGSLQA
jgi:CDP-diacylglycerol--glycerol-3-phosphate 3-phosphatidyltransferase